MTILRKSKILCVLMVVALLATIIAPIGSFTAFAGSAGNYEGFEYVLSDEEVTITGYTGVGGDITIPSLIEGHPVTAIDSGAFYNNVIITSVYAPSVEIVYYEAFGNCTGLLSVNMPNVTSLDDDAFEYCSSLETVYMNELLVIGDYAFDSCTALTVVDFPKVTNVYDGAFLDCEKLETVFLPSLEAYGDYAFSECPSLTTIDVGTDNPYFSTQDGILYNKTKTVLCVYPSGKTAETFTVPDSVVMIGDQAFYENQNIKNVILPNVEYLETSAFDGCENLQSVSGPKVTYIGYEAFDYCHSLSSVSFPRAKEIDTYAFYECTSLVNVTFPQVDEVGTYAFQDCYNLESVCLPNAYLIDERAFSGCSSLVKVDIPRMGTFGTDVFAYCNDALTLYAPSTSDVDEYAEENGINYIVTAASFGDFAYYVTGGNAVIMGYYGSSDNVIIPETIDGYPVTTIGIEAFYELEITTVSAPSVTEIQEEAFAYCEYLVTANIPKAVYLKMSAFDSCYTLESVNMPNVEFIGYEAFDYCYELRSADIPKATFIDEYAFYYCYSLETINMANVIEIGPSAFYNCSKLESVTMPSVLIISNEAFYDCHSLYLVDMPRVTTIGESAFYNCESLQDVIMPSIGTVYSYAFDHCHPDLTIHGYYGSFAELYAGENGYNFSPLNAHTVNFYVEGVITGTQSVMENDFAVEIASPSKEGQYFLGWYTEGGEYYWFDTPVTEDINLYAKFGYYVAIYLDENDTEPVGWMSVEAGQCAEEPAAPGKEGKVFVGWYTEGGTKYDFSTPVTSDINIYAKFVDESAEWVKSVSHSISDGKIYFTVITAPGPYNRVKLTAADDKGGYIAYTNSYTVNSDGDYVWTIKTTAPASTTDYAFDARSSETNKYLKEYYDYTAEIATGIKSVSHEIVGDKLVFTVITGAADYNRVKVSLASDLGSYLAYTNTYTVNADGDYIWTIKITAPSSPEDYSFDIRSASTGKYLKDYYNYSVSVIPTIKSVSHEIVDTKIVFTVVTKPGNFNRIKVTLADNLGGSLGVASDYTVNADGDYVWTVKATAPTVATDYAFDLRSSETSKYTKDYGYYSVTEIPVVKAISYTISNGKIFFTVITEPGNFARMKVTTADNLGGSLGVATTYTVNADGNYVWMLKAPEPTADTTYAVDLRDAATGKYMKDYYYCEAQAKEPTILSATHEIVGDKVIFTVVTKAGSYDRIKVALATSLGTSLAVATTYTVDSDGNYVWTIKTTAPTAETTYAFDLRASGGKYLKDYSYYDVEM